MLYLLSRRTNHCSAYCGQRSIDLESEIDTHHYIVMDYPSKLEAILAADSGFQLVMAWMEDRLVKIELIEVLDGIRQMMEPMITGKEL